MAGEFRHFFFKNKSPVTSHYLIKMALDTRLEQLDPLK
jgi:hypothetical protein